MGTIKDRNDMDLTEEEDIKKRRQEYTEELYKKDLYDPDNHDGMITNLEPVILECEVKWALESITMNKTSGGDGIHSREVPCFVIKFEMLLGTLDTSPKVPLYTGLTPREHFSKDGHSKGQKWYGPNRSRRY